MSDVSTRCLDTFPEWLRALAADASELAKLLGSDAVPEGARRNVAGGLNYLFKSLPISSRTASRIRLPRLDVFVLRVAAAVAVAASPELRQVAPVLARLGNEAAIAELLGSDYARLEAYVKGLARGAARGRTARRDRPPRRTCAVPS